MASIVMFGLMIKDRAHAAVVYGVMMTLLLAGVGVAVWAELQPSPAAAGLAGRAWIATWRARRSATGPSPRRPGRR